MAGTLCAQWLARNVTLPLIHCARTIHKCDGRMHFSKALMHDEIAPLHGCIIYIYIYNQNLFIFIFIYIYLYITYIWHANLKVSGGTIT